MNKKAPSSPLRIGLYLMVVVMAMLSATVMVWAAVLAAGDPRAMTFPPVEFAPPEPSRVVLDNGMVVYLLEDHELPLVNFSAMMRTGGWLEPKDKVGLAALTGSVMRSGGGGGKTA
jgi:zinc protease